VLKATALHGVRIVLHAALIGHVAYQRAIFYFYVFIFYVFIFLEKQFAIGGMAYFDE
jgi:hypothetical protein